MKLIDIIEKRRSYYQIDKNLPVGEDEIIKLVQKATEFTPDSFNMKSSRVIVALGAKHDELWDAIYDAFEGKVPREKIDSFKAGAGTVLYFIDEPTVASLQEKFPVYAANFPHWATQAVGMLEFNVWTGLRELNIGATIQHYNPVINDGVHELFDLPETWVLDAQMPFGGIVAEPDARIPEDIDVRVKIIR